MVDNLFVSICVTKQKTRQFTHARSDGKAILESDRMFCKGDAGGERRVIKKEWRRQRGRRDNKTEWIENEQVTHRQKKKTNIDKNTERERDPGKEEERREKAGRKVAAIEEKTGLGGTCLWHTLGWEERTELRLQGHYTFIIHYVQFFSLFENRSSWRKNWAKMLGLPVQTSSLGFLCHVTTSSNPLSLKQHRLAFLSCLVFHFLHTAVSDLLTAIMILCFQRQMFEKHVCCWAEWMTSLTGDTQGVQRESLVPCCVITFIH